MVGRPGRSKGCFNCRRRKKGCDLGRPSCGQCLKMKQSCEGYGPSLEVVAYIPPATAAVVQKLQDSAIEIKLIESFWENYLPAWPKEPQSGCRDWIGVIRDRYRADSCVKNAVLALTLSRNGQWNGDGRLVQSGSKHYGNCLRTIASAMQPHGTLNDDVLASCLLLGLYEILCAPASAGFNWLNHQLGIGRLIQVRGPHAYISGDSYELFVNARLSVIFAAMVSRKSTFLSSPEWLSIPWKINPKTPFDEIVDICAETAGILEAFDQIELSSQDPDDWEPLLDMCWQLDSTLQKWRQDFLNHIGSPDDTTSSVKNVTDRPLTPGSGATPELAYTLSAYWMACTFVYGTMRVAWQQTDSPLYLLPPRTDPEQYAIFISQSLPHFNSPAAGEESLINYSMAMGAALHYLGLTGEMSGEHGQPILQFFHFPSMKPSDLGHRIGQFLITIQNDPLRLNIQVPKEGRARAIETAQFWWGGGKQRIVLRTRGGSVVNGDDGVDALS